MAFVPDPEDIGPFAANDLTYEFAAVASAALDLLDRNAFADELSDHRAEFVTSQIALILQPFDRVSRSRLTVVTPT